MNTVGITALVPPEIIYGCGKRPVDINNAVPFTKNALIGARANPRHALHATGYHPRSKLCAWTAVWRDLLIERKMKVDSLIVVAGGDCHNALVDGQKVALSGIPTFYFFYPFEDDHEFLKCQLVKLSDFLGSKPDVGAAKKIRRVKEIGLCLEQKRIDGNVKASELFPLLVSFSDLSSNIKKFEERLKKIGKRKLEWKSRIALLGVPPIYPDFHECAEGFGMHVVYDELPYEFLRLGGENLNEIAKSYNDYTFARELMFRIEFLRKELQRRKVDGIIHYTQYACHHVLEDEVLRKELDYPMLTLHGDIPRATPEQIKLRMEAFAEILGRR